jgi:hypothetical protein
VGKGGSSGLTGGEELAGYGYSEEAQQYERDCGGGERTRTSAVGLDVRTNADVGACAAALALL